VVVVLLPAAAGLPVEDLQRCVDELARLPRRGGPGEIADVIARKDGGMPNLVHMHPEETVGRHQVLREYGVWQMPVVQAGAGHPDVMAAEVIGSVVRRRAAPRPVTKRALLEDALDKHLSPPLPQVGSGEPVAD